MTRQTTSFTAADFTPAQGVLVFATGANTALTARPSPQQIAAWNRRVRLPPAVVAAYFVAQFDRLDGPGLETTPRIIFSVKDRNPSPTFVFEAWRRGAAMPVHWNGKHRGERIFRATRILEANSVYGMWCGVTGDFNTAGGKVSLRQQGIGKKIQAVLMPLFMATGYPRMDLHASSEGAHRGAYIWPRFGVEVDGKTADALAPVLRQKFDALARDQSVPAATAREIGQVLNSPDPQLLVRLTDIRCAVDDPDAAGRKAQLSEILLRGQYIKCRFDFESAAWQKRFFSYAGADLRPELQRRLRQAAPQA